MVTQGQGQYHKSIKVIEDDIQKAIKQVNELTGIKESDTGLAAPALWDLAADKQTLQNEQPLQVARCTKIINADSDDPKYIINVKQFAKFVVDLADSVAPTDIEEGMRVGYDKKFCIGELLYHKITFSIVWTATNIKFTYRYRPRSTRPLL